MLCPRLPHQRAHGGRAPLLSQDGTPAAKRKKEVSDTEASVALLQELLQEPDSVRQSNDGNARLYPGGSEQIPWADVHSQVQFGTFSRLFSRNDEDGCSSGVLPTSHHGFVADIATYRFHQENYTAAGDLFEAALQHVCWPLRRSNCIPRAVPLPQASRSFATAGTGL